MTSVHFGSNGSQARRRESQYQEGFVRDENVFGFLSEKNGALSKMSSYLESGYTLRNQCNAVVNKAKRREMIQAYRSENEDKHTSTVFRSFVFKK